MDKITRRNFINGTLMATGATMLPLGCKTVPPLYYPPDRTGLRGSHPGSNTVAHEMAFELKDNWGTPTDLGETYDLVVVGGGLSGLAAAYFYQLIHGTDKKVLILDNHDDFGGHAKRNEHTIDGKTLIGHGGSQSIVHPPSGGSLMGNLFDDIGIDTDIFDNGAYDLNFFQDNGLGAVTFFDEENFGENKVVKHPYCNYPNYLQGIIMGELTLEEAAQQAPLSDAGKIELLAVLNGTGGGGDYYDYLQNDLGVTDPKIMLMARNSALDWAYSGTDTMSTNGAYWAGAMGFPIRDVYDEGNPYIYHFPGGNAGIARALVKKMIPDVAVGNNAEELVLAKFDYSEIDKSSNNVRIRLNSTAVKVEHIGDPASATEVTVNYVSDNIPFKVIGKGVVMACYNNIIPHIVPGLPDAQDTALSNSVRSPLQYTTVGLRNWRAAKEIGMGQAMCPGKMHQSVMMDFPVSLGGYEYTQTPHDPCVLQMIHCPYGTEGAPNVQQYAQARYNMLTMTFEDYEDEIRGHLNAMFPANIFNFDKDVTNISVNRWAHGYAGAGSSTSRQPFHRITIANSDSVGSADALAAMTQGNRAVTEL